MTDATGDNDAAVADRVREYVRTAGRVDAARLSEDSAGHIIVEFARNLAAHQAAIATMTANASRFVVRQRTGYSPWLALFSDEYWEPHRQAVVAAWGQLQLPGSLGFGYDNEGPFLEVGLTALTQESERAVRQALAGHRVHVVLGPNLALA